MARRRTRVRMSRSLRAVLVAALAAVTTTALFEADIGRSALLPSGFVAGVPPALYLLLAVVLLRGAPANRRLAWAVAACGVYAGLGIASGVTLSFAHPMSLEGALRRALWSFAPAPLVHLVAAPLVLLAWRSRVVPARVVVRVERQAPPLAARAPAPPLPPATPDWDSILHVPPPAQWTSSTAAAAFGRAPRERDATPDPRRGRASAPVPAAPAAVAPPVEAAPVPVIDAPAPAVAPPAPMVAAPAPPRPMVAAPTPIVASPAPAGAPRSAPASPRPTPAPEIAPRAPVVTPPPPPALRAPAAAAPAAPTTGTPAGDAEPVVRVPFARLADQLPPDVFTLPPERLAGILQEPHVLLVPRRLVLQQLGEGAVEIAWTLVDGQFPELAFAIPQAEVRRRFPGWVLSLPMDEVVRQIPADLFQVSGPAPDLSDIRDFPVPFTPGPPEPEPEAASGPAVVPPAAPALPAPKPAPVAPPRPPAPAARREPAPAAPPPKRDVAAPAPPPEAGPGAPRPAATTSAGATAADIPDVLFVAVEPPPPAARAARPAEVPAPASTPAPPVPAARPAAPPDEEGAALGRALAAVLAPVGAFDWQARRVGGRPLVSFVPRAVARASIDALAERAGRLAERLGSWGLEQLTVRTARLACVVTPLGARGCLAATVRRGGSVAILELLSARAARGGGDVARPPDGAPAVGPVATTPVGGHNGQQRVGDAARALAAFGTVAPSVAAGDGTAPGVYVFAAGDAATLAGAARAVHEALVDGHAAEALGALESVVLRRGRERVVLRPLREAAGAPAVLVVAGDVALAGRAHHAAARAAALLEAR